MNRNLLIYLIIFLSLWCCSSYKTAGNYKYKLKNKILIGKIPLTAIANDSINFSWYNKRQAKYQVKDSLKQKIKLLLKDVTFDVFLGTWCSDTKLMFPKFTKILDSLAYDKTKVNYYALDKNKKGLTNKASQKNVKFVPTIIVYRGGIELNRIVEKHIVSTEADLLTILSNQGYKIN